MPLCVRNDDEERSSIPRVIFGSSWLTMLPPAITVQVCHHRWPFP